MMWSSAGKGRRLAVALVAALSAGVVAEIALRIPDGAPGVRTVLTAEDPGAPAIQALIEAQTTLNEMIYAPDPELGALLAASRADRVETVDFTYTLRTDHAGFPNPEPWPERLDVAVLGNSLLVGPGVGIEGQFTSLLEPLLGRRVLNLGLPGGGTHHQLLTYRRFVEPLRPRLVVAALWVVWDIDNSMQFEAWLSEGKPNPDFTNYRYTFSATHRIDSSASPGIGGPSGMVGRAALFVRRQLARSRLLRAGYRLAGGLLGREETTVLVRFPGGDDLLLSARDQERLARGMARAQAQDIRGIFFEPLERLRTEVEQAGGRFVIALVPSKEEVYGADTSPAVLRAVEEVKAGLDSLRLPLLDLYPVFRERGLERPPFYYADMHLNELGNQIVADAIATWMSAEGISAMPETN